MLAGRLGGSSSSSSATAMHSIANSSRRIASCIKINDSLICVVYIIILLLIQLAPQPLQAHSEKQPELPGNEGAPDLYIFLHYNYIIRIHVLYYVKVG